MIENDKIMLCIHLKKFAIICESRCLNKINEVSQCTFSLLCFPFAKYPLNTFRISLSSDSVTLLLNAAPDALFLLIQFALEIHANFTKSKSLPIPSALQRHSPKFNFKQEDIHAQFCAYTLQISVNLDAFHFARHIIINCNPPRPHMPDLCCAMLVLVFYFFQQRSPIPNQQIPLYTCRRNNLQSKIVHKLPVIYTVSEFWVMAKGYNICKIFVN